jgi:hypothetical protein
VRHVQAKGATQAISRLGLLKLHDATRTRACSVSGDPGRQSLTTASDDGWAHASRSQAVGHAVRPLSSQGGACRPDRRRRGSLGWDADAELFQIKRYLAPFPFCANLSKVEHRPGCWTLLVVAWAIVL